MEEIKKMIVQKIKVNSTDSLNMAYKYYSILSAISDVKLTEREIQLIAFTAIKGNMSYSSYKEEFCTLYKSSFPTINNMISKLKKLGLLIKDGGKIKVNPQILLNFTDNNITLQLGLIHG